MRDHLKIIFVIIIIIKGRKVKFFSDTIKKQKHIDFLIGCDIMKMITKCFQKGVSDTSEI